MLGLETWVGIIITDSSGLRSLKKVNNLKMKPVDWVAMELH